MGYVERGAVREFSVTRPKFALCFYTHPPWDLSLFYNAASFVLVWLLLGNFNVPLTLGQASSIQALF